MKNIRTFVVVPTLPQPLERLRELAYNLWWSWNPVAIELFRRLDFDLWERVGHNPVALLSRISQTRLEQAARDAAYMAQFARVVDAFQLYINGRTWFQEVHPEFADRRMAYFSAEFGLHESLPIYSGGLGMLAGDHLKAASDLGIPLVAVGLAYRHGYFAQRLNPDGWQMDAYPAHDFHLWCARPAKDPHGAPARVEVALADARLAAEVLAVDVGRVKLYLLNADLAENRHDLRSVTSRLYDSDSEQRIRQEILLGIGGMRALDVMGIDPAVCHMNEGHSAFLALERIRLAMHKHGLTFHEAREVVVSGCVFTTHTPVPAGIDRFHPRLVERYLGPLVGEMGTGLDDLLSLGRETPSRGDDPFSMAVLALRTSFRTNAVSKLHGEVSRAMWQACWPGVPKSEIPIVHVTNGVHVRTWLSRHMAELFDHYLGPGWAEEPDNQDLWKRVDEIPDGELWRTHERRRERLIAVVRNRVREQLRRRGAPPADVESADELLDPEALTVGFARRFAPYKRATLLLRDLDRLAAILNDEERPVQIILGGKAHPNDAAGKELIKQIHAACQRPEFRRRLVLLENYDMDLARELVQGADVWLNTPLRLHEASGTSGMKAVANGALHLSTLDGWWPEAYNGRNGWAIGDGQVYDDLAYQDHVDSESLYNLLEREVAPLFYDRADDNLPRQWLARMKQSMRTICPFFNTHRMLRDYCELLYLPSLRRSARIAADHFSQVRALTAWKQRMAQSWHEVRVVDVRSHLTDELRVGDAFALSAKVHLGPIRPDEVLVEVYHGPLDPNGDIVQGYKAAMTYQAHSSNGEHVFEASVPCLSSGQHGYALRVIPFHADLAHRYEPGYLVWG